MRKSKYKLMLATGAELELQLEHTVLWRSEVRVFKAGERADPIELARRERPDLAVVNVSGDNGASLEVCSRLKADPFTGGIPIILLVDPSLAERGRNSGADVLVSKPVGWDEFLGAVRRFLRLRERKSPRHPFNLRFTYRYGEVRGQAFSRDLSSGGVFLKSTDRQRLSLDSRRPLRRLAGAGVPAGWATRRPSIGLRLGGPPRPIA